MKRLHRPAPVRMLCLALVCLAGLTACTPGDADPAPIEVPPPVEQTNEGLTIFCTDFSYRESTILDAAVNQFNQLHPETPVTLDKHFTDESIANHQEAYTKMITEVMAGDGPDMFLYDYTTMDIEKMARRGVFADMQPYFEADNFDWSGYNQAVMDGGVWDGHRLVIPLEYELPMLYTSQGALDETGFDVENCGSFDGLLTEVEKMQANPEQDREVFRTKLTFYYFPHYAGIPYVDYDRQIADLSFPELERGMAVYKNLNGMEIGFGDGNSIAGAADIRDGKCLWICPEQPLDGFFTSVGVINKFDDAVMLPIRDVEGGIQARVTSAIAVRNSSPNLQIAYEFIKFLLSEEFQVDTLSYRWHDFSVLDATNAAYYQRETTEREQSKISPDNSFGFEGNIEISQADFDELMSYLNDVSGTFYFAKEANFVKKMSAYLAGEESYEAEMRDAKRQLDIYLSE